jgi:hypothetical protein
MKIRRSCIALGSNTYVHNRRDSFSLPRPRPTDLALVTVHAVSPDARRARTGACANADASAQCVPVKYVRRGSGGEKEKFYASGAISADAL